MLLKSKLENAQLLPEHDFPVNIVTLDSRVTYSVNSVFTDTRIISAQKSSNIVGLSLSVSTLRGLALIGLKEGQSFSLHEFIQSDDLLNVEKVQFQPEAHRQFLKDSISANSPLQRRASIKLVHSTSSCRDIYPQTSR